MSTTHICLGDVDLVTKLSRDSATDRSWTDGQLNSLLGARLCRQFQRAHPRSQPLHTGALHWRTTRTSHRQATKVGLSRRRRARAHRHPVIGSNEKFQQQGQARGRSSGPSQFKGKANGTQPSGGAPYELPNGQWCLKGTCQFNNDKVNPGGPCYCDPRWPGPLPEKVLKNKQQVERNKNVRENNAKRLQVANLPICSAIAAGHEHEQVIDVNEIGKNFTLLNAVEAATGDQEDDQGEQTDPSLDYAVLTNTNTAPFDTAIHLPTSPQARAAAQYGKATPLFQTPTMPHAPTTDII
eukprot:5396691-Pleurochrysis_carterae.AAC.3